MRKSSTGSSPAVNQIKKERITVLQKYIIYTCVPAIRIDRIKVCNVQKFSKLTKKHDYSKLKPEAFGFLLASPVFTNIHRDDVISSTAQKYETTQLKTGRAEDFKICQLKSKVWCYSYVNSDKISVARFGIARLKQ